MEARSPPRRASFVALVVALIGLKLVPLCIFGPTMMPDSAGYTAYADAILDGSFRHVDLASDAIPITLTRPIGYPAVIAAAKWIAPNAWAWWVVLFQFAFSVWATVAVYRLSRAFRLPILASFGVAAAQATSMQFVVDQAILSDSLCGSAMTIAACILSEIVLRTAPPQALRFLGSGILIVVAYLMRNVIEFLSLGLAPLAAAASMVEPTRLRRLGGFVLVCAPLIATHVVYIAWNESRVGAPVVATISQLALLGALAEATRYDPTIFSGPTEVDTVSRRVFKELTPAEGIEVNNLLHSEYGWDSIRANREVTAAYLRAWRDHPVAMVRHALSHFSETQVHQAVRATETIRDVLLWNTGSDHDFARDRAVRDNWLMIPAVIFHRLIETASVVIFSAFLLLTPYRVVREGLTAEAQVCGSLWFSYLLSAGMYAAVHLEPRYLTPVVAGSIVVGAANIAWLIAELRQRRATAAPRRAA